MRRSRSAGDRGERKWVDSMPTSRPDRLIRGVDWSARMPAARIASRMGLPAKMGLAVTSPTTTRSPRSRAVPQVLSPRRMTAKSLEVLGPESAAGHDPQRVGRPVIAAGRPPCRRPVMPIAASTISGRSPAPSPCLTSRVLSSWSRSMTASSAASRASLSASARRARRSSVTSRLTVASATTPRSRRRRRRP